MIEPIKIKGLKEFSRALRKVDSDLPKALRIANNEAADIVVEWAVPHVPKRTGKAAASLKAKSTRTAARVAGGSSSAPYYPWLDFGGRVGPQNSVRREFIKEGRYMYPGYRANHDQIIERLEVSLRDLAVSANLAVDA